MFEQKSELPTNIINVLKRPKVSRFIQDLLKHKSIEALVLYDNGRTTNEVQVVGVDSKNTKEAENALKGVIDQKSHRLTAENAQVLGSRKWKDFQSSVTSHFKAAIAVDDHASDICVSGIANDVKECLDEVKKFLEFNTIKREVVPVEDTAVKFIFTTLKEKIDGIKKELSHCSIDIRVATDCEGIEVWGTAEGLEMCLPQLRDLIGAVQQDFVPIEKPRILQETLEEKKSIILTTKGTEEESVAETEAEETEEEESSVAEVDPPNPSTSVQSKDLLQCYIGQ